VAKAVVTARMLKEMQQDRATKMTYKAIAAKHGISYSTAVYHLDPHQAMHWRYLWRKRNARIMADPEQRRAYNEYQRQKYHKEKRNVSASD
jgi:hypothetical protein